MQDTMKIKEQTIQALDDLSVSDLMLVHEWINQLRESHHAEIKSTKWKISYEQLHAATRHCRSSFSEEIIKQREERL